MKLANMFDLPAQGSGDEASVEAAQEEVFDELLRGGSFRLERIVSKGQATPAGSWYDQPHDEWVLLLCGRALLRFEGESQPRELKPGAYEARLVSVAYQPGAATALRRRTGPELAYTLDGAWALEYAGVPFTFGADQGYLADPGVPHRLRNVGTEPARVLSALLVPSGQPADEPSP